MANRDVTDPPGEPRSRGMISDDEIRSLRKPFRWHIWLPVVAFLVGMVVVYVVAEKRRGRRLREQLLREHAVLTETLAPAYRQRRARIERLTHSVVGPWQGEFTAPGLTMETLTRQPVLYGRVRAGEIHRVEDVAASIRHRYADQIAACLGLEATPVHEFYRKGDFLMPSYVDSVSRVSDGDRLAVLRHDLQFRLQRDTPELVEWGRRRYLVLAVDEAALSIDGPTRIYVWDLDNERLLFRSRGGGDETVLIPFRVAGIPGGGRPVPQPSARLTLTQHDCSVANTARQQLGVPVLTMANAPDVRAAEGDAGAAEVTDAGSPDAAATADGHAPGASDGGTVSASPPGRSSTAR